MRHTHNKIKFSPFEVAIYYHTRLPELEQKDETEWRGGCPLHEHDPAEGLIFFVDAQTGHWFCSSSCERGDIISLEMSLSAADFKESLARIFYTVRPRKQEPWL